MAVIRVERLYPLPLGEIRTELARYSPDAEVMWVQDEPANMGAWPLFGLKLPGCLDRKVTRVSRPTSSSPAVGSAKLNAAEQQALMTAVFG